MKFHVCHEGLTHRKPKIDWQGSATSIFEGVVVHPCDDCLEEILAFVRFRKVERDFQRERLNHNA